MSGGSMNYIYSEIKEITDRILEKDICALTEDLADLLHDLEWYSSGDYSEGTYNKTLESFRQKWIIGDPDERMKQFVKESCEETKKQLMAMIGCKFYCKDCEHFTSEGKDSDYGRCDVNTHCMYHGWNSSCKDFGVRE